MAYCIVLVTVPDAPTGKKIARLLVENKLAACVNQLPGLESTFWWQDKIETAKHEELLIAKTEKTRVKAMVKLVRENHPSSIPEIISLPIKEGYRAYLQWIGESVGAVKARPRKKAKKNRARKQSLRDKKKNAKAARQAQTKPKKG